MDIDGDNLLANLAMARVQYFSGDEFERMGERVLALRRDNAEGLSLIGAMHVIGGDLDRGLAMVERAISLAPNAPGGYYATQALGLLRAGRNDEALAAALRIDSPSWPMGHLIVTATAALAGRAEVAQRSRERLLAVHPQIEPELPAVLDRWRVAPDLRVALRRGLEAAGLSPQ
jgi:tetratricopeptide (TPR) repeat protein